MNEGPFQHVNDAIGWVHQLLTLGIKPGLKRMEWMMEQLGNPHRRLKFIHIAGTNGKGSVASFLSYALREAGYDVGTFTSPYIIRFQNRIQYNLKDIPDQDLMELTSKVKPLAEELSKTEWGSPTEFEVITAMAILYFATVSFPDYVVWETGLGGRLDSTNIVHPVVSIITNIGYDHINILGESLKSIASEKAGIIKSGVPVVTAEEKKEALSVIEEMSQLKKASLYRFNQHFFIKEEHFSKVGQRFSFQSPFKEYSGVEIQLLGKHQLMNAAVALMALEILRQYNAAILEEEDVKRGMAKAFWPGRFEKVSEKPLVILDGAHNPEGMSSLVDALIQLYPEKEKHVILGVLKDKNYEEMVRRLTPICSSLTLTRPFHERGANPEEVAEKIKPIIGDATVFVESQWEKVLRIMMNDWNHKKMIVITGSLYFISDVRKFLVEYNKERIGD
ncbi:bifunctional folylpolyglutamate synthase/dihydrofolate synthase [Microaerobacter geothermalis]|uniref:bifunctional folylpolyglutamate synthase/dihydrofolate synthase n=1 Tax=Microaerobacter geothermalis TaxID=674972 RepID=UPI001F214F27|nr:folylpolyglutamate synthase/dihydrofolate synthase family protein [Microaerobacter geothermalis]MCF6092690.1 bifunctional folylpolyglutamate synthase/dihydrofolate synthase [Microaerobacter geothermalis]